MLDSSFIHEFSFRGPSFVRVRFGKAEVFFLKFGGAGRIVVKWSLISSKWTFGVLDFVVVSFKRNENFSPLSTHLCVGILTRCFEHQL